MSEHALSEPTERTVYVALCRQRVIGIYYQHQEAIDAATQIEHGWVTRFEVQGERRHQQ